MSECTCLPSSPIPSSAMRRRLLPSKVNGLVTTPTVRMPSSLATSATTGPAPVPVPPPMPAVMNTMCAPLSAARISSRAVSAEARPCSGLAPAPRPVRLQADLHRRIGSRQRLRVGIGAMKSTPLTPL